VLLQISANLRKALGGNVNDLLRGSGKGLMRWRCRLPLGLQQLEAHQQLQQHLALLHCIAPHCISQQQA
jgi:hypothetical protein